jgi:hypothetical protein
MKKRIATLLIGLSVIGSLPAQADDLGINVVLEGEVAPGVYGRVELGKGSRPETYYPQPMLIVQESRHPRYQPVYLHVPPGHAKNWGKHCNKYHACDRPVYFIKSAEYEESYQQEREHEHAESKGKGKGKENGNHKGKH